MQNFNPHPITVTTHGITIEPLTLDHFEPYYEALMLDPHTMDLYSFPPKSLSPEHVREFITARIAAPNIAQVFTANGKVLGSSSYYDISLENHSLEIGYTWMAAPYRGTNLNPIVKLAMIGAAFDDFGAERVKLITSSKNVRSQKAMENIGLSREGTFRRDRLIHDGTYRDTVVFSVIKPEWPDFKSNLESIIQSKQNWHSKS
ncbi:MAG: GNAT family N-acetyltransferase [Fimbriimonadaceae bacterium]